MKYEILEHLNCIDIEIAGVKYRTKMVSKIENDNVGETNYSKKEIMLVNKTVDGELCGCEFLQENLLHEIAHAWLCQTGNQDLNDERHAELLSMFANRISKLIDNDLLNYLYRLQEEKD